MGRVPFRIPPNTHDRALLRKKLNNLITLNVYVKKLHCKCSTEFEIWSNLLKKSWLKLVDCALKLLKLVRSPMPSMMIDAPVNSLPKNVLSFKIWEKYIYIYIYIYMYVIYILYIYYMLYILHMLYIYYIYIICYIYMYKIFWGYTQLAYNWNYYFSQLSI